MDKVYKHQDIEDRIYKKWEEKGYFKPETNPDGKPFCIILPPPNANAPLHFGHAMYVFEDILVRYHRMRGDGALWLPGADHAGFETQYVFEKKLQEQGKTRFDYEPDVLYQMIWDYVLENKQGMENQLRKLGFSLDWSRKKFTLDPGIVKIVYKTFQKLYQDGLVFRAKRLINYCTYDGTSFSDIEIVYEQRNNPLYYIKYGPLTLATTRPETKFGDTAVAVHPDDSRYKKYIGREIEIETVLGKAKIKVIADSSVEPSFGTGVVKITPAHDFNDFEVGQRHNLEMRQVIGFDGRMNHHAGKYNGMFVKKARAAVVEDLKKQGLIEKIDENYIHRIGLCYKCKAVIEPLPLEQWFVRVGPLAKNAIKVVKDKKIKIYPKSFEKWYFQWLENLRDWNISRQTVWGIKIPAWQCYGCKLRAKIDGSREDIIPNTSWIVTDGKPPKKCPFCKSTNLTQDTDTFDTWFSSAQWPFATLGASQKKDDFVKFYPTSVIETGYDILKAWVSRMVMVGLYITGKPPFKDVVLHGLVNDPYGKKMSKSKGNVVNPMELVDQYGADAVRLVLAYGTALGNDQGLSYPKLTAARNFTNKLWNIGRFIKIKKSEIPVSSNSKATGESKKFNLDFAKTLKIAKNPNDKKMIRNIQSLAKDITKLLDSYDFNNASQKLYDFTWHTFADKYIEDVKNRLDEASLLVLACSFLAILKLLHPFMPFVTEEIAKNLNLTDKMLIVEIWPCK